MDPLFALDAEVGFFTRQDALAAGYDDRDLARSVDADEVRRIRNGSFARAESWDAMDEVQRHRVRARAVVRALKGAVCLSHVSASIEHGADIWGYSLDRVHVTRLDGGSSRVEGDVVHHRASVPPEDLVTLDGNPVTCASRSAIETATTGTPEAALGLFDSLLHRQAMTVDELHERQAAMAHWPRVRRIHVPIRLADPRPESIGESRGMWFFWSQHLPKPTPQVPVHDANGVVVAVCDWGWPELNAYGEFDGRIKLGRLLKPGQTPGDVVFAEKQREDMIRGIGNARMFRLIWDDFSRPRVARQRFLRQLG